jgi:hypothetical protein
MVHREASFVSAQNYGARFLQFWLKADEIWTLGLGFGLISPTFGQSSEIPLTQGAVQINLLHLI